MVEDFYDSSLDFELLLSPGTVDGPRSRRALSAVILSTTWSGTNGLGCGCSFPQRNICSATCADFVQIDAPELRFTLSLTHSHMSSCSSSPDPFPHHSKSAWTTPSTVARLTRDLSRAPPLRNCFSNHGDTYHTLWLLVVDVYIALKRLYVMAGLEYACRQTSVIIVLSAGLCRGLFVPNVELPTFALEFPKSGNVLVSSVL